MYGIGQIVPPSESILTMRDAMRDYARVASTLKTPADRLAYWNLLTETTPGGRLLAQEKARRDAPKAGISTIMSNPIIWIAIATLVITVVRK